MTISNPEIWLGALTLLASLAHIALHLHIRHVQSEVEKMILLNDRKTREWADLQYVRRVAV